MKEILFLRRSVSMTTLGGIELQMLKLARGLAEREVLAPALVTSTVDSEFARRFGELGFPVFAEPMGKRDVRRCAAAVGELVDRRPVALVQSHDFRGSLIGRALRRRRPSPPHLLREHITMVGTPLPRWRLHLHYLLSRWTARWVDAYAVNGEFIRREIVERMGGAAEKVHVLYDGVDSPGAPDPPCDAPEAPLPPRIAMVANLFPRKGHDVLVEGLALLKARGLTVQARLIGHEEPPGAGEDRGADGASFTDALRAEAERRGVLGQLEFAGYQSDVFQALRDAPALVLPSDGEGVPNCMLEAMALRKIVVVSRVGGVPEVVRDGENGLLHPPRDAGAFADCLERVFTRPAGEWEPLRDAGRRTWEENFTLERMLDEFIALYKELDVLD